MSQWRGRIEEIDEPGDLLPYLERYYHIPTLLGLLAFMLWTRARNWDNFVVGDRIYYSGNDPWYHYRMVSYTVRNWPGTSPFDPWTYFPFGTHSSQFGTVFDQLMATAALVVGLGNPSDQTVRMVVLFAPAVFGVATAIPVYYIGKRAAGRFAGIVAVGVLATFASTFVSRGTVGFADHHIAEVLFMSVSILATMVAVSVAQKEKPVWELLREREVAAVRRPVGWAVVAGVATAVYIWTWAPGVFLIGILGVYYLVELSSLQAHGESPEPVAIVGAVSMLTTGVLALAPLEEIDIGATSYSLLQPGMAFAVAAGCVFMAWLAREWDTRETQNYQYPVAVVGIIVVLAGLMALVLPNLFDFLISQVLRVLGLGVNERAATIGEAQPLPFENLYSRYRFTHFIAIAGVLYVAVRQVLTKARSDLVLLALWTVFMRRFDYYLGVTVALMVGYTIASLADFASLFEDIEDIQTYQVVSIVAIVVVVFAPLVVTGSGILAVQATGGNNGPGPGQDPIAWNESLSWMQDNTPEEGNLRGAGNDMPFYGTFEATDDFDYEEGFYGVMSWWDYGHWITQMSERIPNANPFQQGADQAANFLLSQSEDDANDVLDDLDDGEGTETRYVMVDWKMATTERLYATGYYESTAIRLYHFHGSAIEPEPVVLDWERESVGQGSIPVSQGIQRFDNMSAARQYVREDGSAQVGGVGRYPEERVPAMEHYRLVGTSDRTAFSSQRYTQLAMEKVSQGAFQQRFVGQGGINRQVNQQIHPTTPNWVKVFERVPGATIQGQGPENQTVQVAVRMLVPGSNTTFVYRQQTRTDQDGQFSVTVPYSTTGYDEFGPEEGYTDPEVRADTAYQVRTTGITTNESGYAYRFAGTANVSEAQVIGEDDSPTTVDLERQVLGGPQPGNETAGNESDSGDTGGDGETTPTPTATPDGGSSDGSATPTDSATPTATAAQSVDGNSGGPLGILGTLAAVALPLAGTAALRRR
ncbi:oligosaccharyl transferase, archaeosortase A system-associated [Halobacteriales archaeon QH_7_68_42]|nr:MAG: oligosaccharyl transferase, archaeosortase A system-associated [Halobacteriales archaeon QH_7_68_42]